MIQEELRGFNPDHYCFVIDRLPTPAELRTAENENRMLLNVVLLHGFDPTPLDWPSWTKTYLDKAGLWESNYMSIRFALPGQDPVAVAADWAKALEDTLRARSQTANSEFALFIKGTDHGSQKNL